MIIKRLILVFGAAALSLPLLAAAEKFDGSQPFICAVTEVLECYEKEGCSHETTRATRAPEFLRVDLKKKSLVAQTDHEPRDSEILHSSQKDNVLVMHGFEDLRGWVVTVVTNTGEMSATVAGEEIAFVLFGNCTIP
jgi:hypothetical protein